MSNIVEPILTIIADARKADPSVEPVYRKAVCAIADWMSATQHFNEKPGFWRRQKAGWSASEMKVAIDNLQVSINSALKRPDRTLSPLLGPLRGTEEDVAYIFKVANVLEPAAQLELLARRSNLFRGKYSWDDATKLEFASAMTAMLELRIAVVGKASIEDEQGYPKRKALGYVWGVPRRCASH